jgi:hypothetical protein
MAKATFNSTNKLNQVIDFLRNNTPLNSITYRITDLCNEVEQRVVADESNDCDNASLKEYIVRVYGISFFNELMAAIPTTITQGPVITELETAMFKAMLQSDFYDGKGSIMWDFSVYDYCPYKGKKRSGVISSLVQKGFITITESLKKYIKNADGTKDLNPHYHADEPEANYGTIAITQAGHQALETLNMTDQDGYSI